MEPTLHCGRPGFGCSAATPDRLIARPYGQHRPRRGDIVGVRVPPLAVSKCGNDGIYLKRIIGLPGETWQERSGYVFIDGRKLREPYIKTTYRDLQTHPSVKVAPGHYLLMGDNRAVSCDSRQWGTVTKSAIEARAIAIYWPLSRAHLL
jgi:signal peptidase I